jgi:hypothetical protein
MTKEQFLNRLKDLKLNKKEFSDISTIPYSTVNNWGTLVNNKPLPIPPWVESYLIYYEKSKKFDYIRKDICAKIKEIED